MDKQDESLNQKVISYILPAACGIFIGFIFFQGKIFQPHMTLFQFVVISVEASIIFNILKDTGLRNSIAAAFVIFVVNSFFTRSFFSWAYLLRDVLYNLVTVFSVFLFFRIFYHAAKPYLYPLAFGFLLLFIHLIVDLTLILIYSVPEIWKLLYVQIAIAGLIGVGLGTGILINDSLTARQKENEDTDTEKL